MNKLLIITIAITTFWCTSKAQNPAVITSDKTGWHKIGETTVDFSKDRDEIAVVGADRFASIKFKVTDAPIDLQDLEVYYESGDKQDVQVRTPINSGGESRVIDLNGGERALKKIVFIYKTLPNHAGEKAHVEIYGLKTNQDNDKKAGDQKDNNTEKNMTAWNKIGERTVDFKNDHDEIAVNGSDRYSWLRFRVTDASIDLRDVTVYYENGDKQDIQVSKTLTKGSYSGVIDLNGGTRALKKIVFVYKTIPNQQQDKAHVEVWGLKQGEGKSGDVQTDVMENDKIGWHQIAETTVDFKTDRDEIPIAGAFSSIKLKVTDAFIDLQDLEVYYDNGDKQDVQIGNVIAKGGESRVIDLKGGEKSLKKIVLVYKTVENQKDQKAHVEVWGLKTNETTR